MDKRTKTTEQFIIEAKNVHGDKYDYSQSIYTGAKNKVAIVCRKHGIFYQIAGNHTFASMGCRECGIQKVKEKRTNDTEYFIKQAKLVHGDKYDYSQTIYKGSKHKIKIICPKHGPFFQSAKNHTSKILKRGCAACGIQKGIDYNLKSTEYFIKKAKKIYGDKYDYSKSIYTGTRGKLCVTCPKHGDFYVLPEQHYTGNECRQCNKLKKYSIKDFLLRAHKIYGNTFDYSKVNFVNCSTKIEIICREHGSFFQTPNSHLRGTVCPSCSSSSGETQIEINLKRYGIKYLKEYRIKECRNINPLPFDFYIPQINTLIEYQGQQHYRVVNFGGKCGKKAFESTVKNDKIKKEFCLKNGIMLLEIPFVDFYNIENIIRGLERIIVHSS